MNNLNIIQYLPLTHPRATLRFVKRLNAAGVMTILDLEDSAQDPFNVDITRTLKINARNNFLDLVNSKTWLGDEFAHPIYVRVNSINTEFFEEDINTVLKIFASGFPITGIFLPMVDSYDQIEKTHSLLAACRQDDNSFIEIVPMIETNAGMQNLNTILQSDVTDSKFSKIHYGHFDYCLDAKLWPFPDPQHDTFWRLIEPMIQLILDHKKTYIHTPFPFPNDSELFWAASRHLQMLYQSKDIWFCTLNSELSLSIDNGNNKQLTIFSPDTSENFCINEAKIIQNNFLDGRANRRSFGVSNNRFIPPHQFFGAEEYLKKIQKD